MTGRHRARKTTYWTVRVVVAGPAWLIGSAAQAVADSISLLRGPMSRLRDWSDPDRPRPTTELPPAGKPDDRAPI